MFSSAGRSHHAATDAAVLPSAEMLLTWLREVERISRAAGELARQKFTETHHVHEKGFRDIVTDVDLASQHLIMDAVQERFPEHGFLAEEEDAVPTADHAVQWIIDPIDGTTNYSRQIPTFCISVAVAVRGQVVAGAVYAPMQDELFSAALGHGCTLNGRTVTVSAAQSVGEAVVSLDWCHDPQERAATLRTLQGFGQEARSIRGIGSAALALAWIAAGRLDAYFNLHLYPWDVAAGGLLVTEAGGRITDVAGQPMSLAPDAPTRTTTGLATNGTIHAEMRRLIDASRS